MMVTNAPSRCATSAAGRPAGPAPTTRTRGCCLKDCCCSTRCFNDGACTELCNFCMNRSNLSAMTSKAGHLPRGRKCAGRRLFASPFCVANASERDAAAACGDSARLCSNTPIASSAEAHSSMAVVTGQVKLLPTAATSSAASSARVAASVVYGPVARRRISVGRSAQSSSTQLHCKRMRLCSRRFTPFHERDPCPLDVRATTHTRTAHTREQ